MAAKSVTALPIGEDWLYEAKLHGYGVLALKIAERVRLLSRNNKDLTRDFAHIATAVSRVKADTALLDGEIVAVDAAGVPRFQLLQHRSTTARRQIVYYAFDLLHLRLPACRPERAAAGTKE